jgi:hypothetical protein
LDEIALHTEVARRTADAAHREQNMADAYRKFHALARELGDDDDDDDEDEEPRKHRSANLGLHVRLAGPVSAIGDMETRTVRATLATEDACISHDLKTGKSFLEVYLMSGMEPVQQVPLCDTHKRDSIDRVLGSVRSIGIQGDTLTGELSIVDNAAWSKIANRHVTDVSSGFEPLQTLEIKAGRSGNVDGRTFTAPADRSLFVHTRWRLREVSLTAIGADGRAKIR